MRAAAVFGCAGLGVLCVTIWFLATPMLAGVVIAVLLAIGGFLRLPTDKVLGVASSAALVLAALAPITHSGILQFTAAGVAGGIVTVGLFRSRCRLKWTNFATVVCISQALLLTTTIFSTGGNWFYASTAIGAIPVMIASQSMNPWERRFTERSIITLASMLATIALIETFLVHHLLFRDPPLGQSPHAFILGAVRAETVVGHPLVLGFLLTMAYLILINGANKRLLRIALSVLLVAGVVATGSASILALMVIGTLATGMRMASASGKVTLAVLGAAGLVIVFVGRLVPDTLLSQFEGINASQRLNSVAAVPAIVGRQSAMNSILGNGWGSAGDLYKSGLIGQSRSMSIDNQFVTTLIDSGILGTFLLCVCIVVTMRKHLSKYGPALIAVLALFFSFDLLLWTLPAMLVVFLASGYRDVASTLGESQIQTRSAQSISAWSRRALART